MYADNSILDVFGIEDFREDENPVLGPKNKNQDILHLSYDDYVYDYFN
jgi:hypothetical protein